jgi:ankyrin repeat protein
MAQGSDLLIRFEKPKKSAKAFFYVSEGLLSALHTEKASVSLDLKLLDSFRRTPLHYSSYLDLEAMSLYLLLSGVDSFLLDKSNQSCFHSLFSKGNYKTLQIFLNYDCYMLNKELFEWTTLLKFGISMKNITLRNTIAFYLSKTMNLAKLPTRPVDSVHQLKMKIEEYHKKTLDRYKFILMSQDTHKRTPLHYAAASKFTWCFKAVETIFSASTSFPNFSFYFKEIYPLLNPGKTVDPEKYAKILQQAYEMIDSDEAETMQKSFKAKIDALFQSAVNLKDINGQTPLHLACLAGDCKIVKLLVSKGADSGIKDSTGKSPLDLCSTKLVMRYLTGLAEAVAGNQEKGVVHLVNSGYSINETNSTFMLSSIHQAILSGKLLKTVLECAGNVNQSEWNLYTPLHYASISGRASDASFLLNEGANVMAQSLHQVTPLHLASRYNHADVVSVLLQSGAGIDAKDHLGRTPLMFACKYGAVNTAELLLSHDCDMNATDQRAWNALHYASFHCQSKVVKMIVRWDADDEKLQQAKNSQGKNPVSLTSDLRTKAAFESKI